MITKSRQNKQNQNITNNTTDNPELFKDRLKINSNSTIKEAMNVLLHNSKLRLKQTSIKLNEANKTQTTRSLKYDQKWYINPNKRRPQANQKQAKSKIKRMKLKKQFTSLMDKFGRNQQKSDFKEQNETKSSSSESHISEMEKELEEVVHPEYF